MHIMWRVAQWHVKKSVTRTGQQVGIAQGDDELLPFKIMGIQECRDHSEYCQEAVERHPAWIHAEVTQAARQSLKLQETL
jgi:hypothetical protein